MSCGYYRTHFVDTANRSTILFVSAIESRNSPMPSRSSPIAFLVSLNPVHISFARLVSDDQPFLA